MRSIVVSAEGVLRKFTDGSPIREGIELVSNFTGDRDSMIFLTGKSVEGEEDWLNLNGITRHDLILGKEGLRVQQLRRIQHEYGYTVDLVIEPDPSVCAELVANGYTTLGFFSPYFSNPEWRPDHSYSIRPWHDLAASIADTARQRAAAEVKLRDGLL
jgi:hypothetical protein